MNDDSGKLDARKLAALFGQVSSGTVTVHSLEKTPRAVPAPAVRPSAGPSV